MGEGVRTAEHVAEGLGEDAVTVRLQRQLSLGHGGHAPQRRAGRERVQHRVAHGASRVDEDAARVAAVKQEQLVLGQKH